MEFSVPLMIAISISTFFFFFLLRYSRRPSHHLPPGTFGFPLIGETLQLISAYKSDNPEPFVDKRVKRYGPVFTTHLFGEPTVFSGDPEVNRFILQNEGKLVESSYPSSLSNLLGKNSLVLMKGDIHKKMHTLTLSFGNSTIIKDHLLKDMDRLVRLNMDSWSDRILLLDVAKKITFELAMRQLMSLDPGQQIESIRKQYVLMVEGFFSLPVPLLSPTYRRAIQARKKVAEALIGVVRQRVKDFQAGERKNDMLNAMLAAAFGFSEEVIVDFLVALLVGGYETTSTTMTFAAKLLYDHPSALAQLKEEHNEIRAKKKESEPLEWSDYKSMRFTQCVINETLRIANIVGGVFRRANEDIHIKGYTIPKGWKILASIRAVHLGSDCYKDARTFNPWRWQNNTVPGSIFIPFGGGPRLCPGYELARVQLSVFLHHLVTRFSWIPTEEDKFVFLPTTRAVKGFPIKIQRRSD